MGKKRYGNFDRRGLKVSVGSEARPKLPTTRRILDIITVRCYLSYLFLSDFPYLLCP